MVNFYDLFKRKGGPEKYFFDEIKALKKNAPTGATYTKSEVDALLAAKADKTG